MNLEKAKHSLIKRYMYLYENAPLILAPFIHEPSDIEYILYKTNMRIKYNINWHSTLLISKVDKINELFEEFLFSDKKIKDTKLYQLIESKKEDKEYLENVKRVMNLVSSKNEKENKLFNTRLNIETILQIVNNYINEQSGDLKNKKNKLKVLNEYFNLLYYFNNQMSSTLYRPKIDLENHNTIEYKKSLRSKEDVGVRKNNFIKAILALSHNKKNSSIFTDNEKQKVYLNYHDELPWNLQIKCQAGNESPQVSIVNSLNQSDYTNSCKKLFLVNENDIFIDPNSLENRYYQICPYCGYIVNIPESLLSDGIKQRIEERCKKDNKLFKKMLLYSKIINEDEPVKNNSRVMKKNSY